MKSGSAELDFEQSEASQNSKCETMRGNKEVQEEQTHLFHGLKIVKLSHDKQTDDMWGRFFQLLECFSVWRLFRLIQHHFWRKKTDFIDTG